MNKSKEIHSNKPTTNAMASEKHMILISFDIEATGQNLINHAMIELGVAILRTDTGKTLLKKKWDIKLIEGRTWDLTTLKEFWNNDSWKALPPGPKRDQEEAIYNQKQERVKRVNEGKGTDFKVVMNEFMELAEKAKNEFAGGDSDRVRLASNTVAFDSSWVNVYLSLADLPCLHILYADENGRRKMNDVISTSDVIRGYARTTHAQELQQKKLHGWYSSKTYAREKLKIPEYVQVQASHDHSAENDAEHIGKTYILAQCWVEQNLDKVEEALGTYQFAVLTESFIADGARDGLLISHDDLKIPMDK